jgi:hypothetical protein
MHKQSDIIGKENPLSGRIWLEAQTPLGDQIIREAAQEIYGDSTITRILYVTLACEGAFVVARMAEKGARVELPLYTLDGETMGREALESLG